MDVEQINFHHLRYFWAVAKAGNLTRTAARLHVAQSALSSQIRQLEEQLGQALFRREGRNLVLTEAGTITLAYAEDIFKAGGELLSTLAAKGRPLTHRFVADALSDIFSPDRVRILKIDIKLDMSKENSTAEEFSPIAVEPATRFAPAKYAPSIARSTQNTEEHFQGTGFNPEGPAGVEGQTPPAYKDLSNLVGKYDKTSQTTNNEINKKVTTSEKQPWDIRGISTGVAIDGVWKQKYDKGGRVMLNVDGRSFASGRPDGQKYFVSSEKYLL
jgi:hypothetical protein